LTRVTKRASTLVGSCLVRRSEYLTRIYSLYSLIVVLCATYVLPRCTTMMNLGHCPRAGLRSPKHVIPAVKNVPNGCYRTLSNSIGAQRGIRTRSLSHEEKRCV
jgi:hypothetical protein